MDDTFVPNSLFITLTGIALPVYFWIMTCLLVKSSHGKRYNNILLNKFPTWCHTLYDN